MGKYVDVDAVIAELEKRKKKNVLNEGAFEEDIDIIYYLESLKIKEVNVELDELLSDLDKEIKDFITTDEFDKESAIGGHYWAIAKHAFLLGIKHENKCFNATIKEYTDLSQSERLKEILPPESCKDTEAIYRPAWSLAALLSVLPEGTRLLKSSTGDTYHCDCPKGNIDKWYDNPVDAAFELIVKLHEQKLL